MPSLSQPDNWLVLGVGGSGKSTLARRRCDRFARVIICDPNGEEAWADGALVTDDPGELVDFARFKTFRIVYRIPDDPKRQVEAYDWATRVALAAGDACLVWDEVDLYIPRQLTAPAAQAWNAGRHRRVRITAIARSPFAVSPHLRRNLTELWAFATDEAADVDWYRQRLGVDGAERIRSLAMHQAVHHERGRPWVFRDLKNS